MLEVEPLILPQHVDDHKADNTEKSVRALIYDSMIKIYSVEITLSGRVLMSI